jgi:hypothetical protein
LTIFLLLALLYVGDLIKSGGVGTENALAAETPAKFDFWVLVEVIEVFELNASRKLASNPISLGTGGGGP